jgi:hypothetical protein
MLQITNPQTILDALFGARDGETYFRVAKAVAYQIEWPALSSVLWTHRAARIVPANAGVTNEDQAIFAAAPEFNADATTNTSCWDNTDADELGSVAVELPRINGELLLPIVRQYRADIHSVGELLRKDTARAVYFPAQPTIAEAIGKVVAYKSADAKAKENEATLDAEAVAVALSTPAVLAMEAARKARKIARAESFNARVNTAESAAALAKAMETEESKAEAELVTAQTEITYVLEAYAAVSPAVFEYEAWEAMPLWFQHRVGTAVYDVLASKLAGINGQRMMQRANESDKSFAAREAARDALVTLCSDLADELMDTSANWEVAADTARRTK